MNMKLKDMMRIKLTVNMTMKLVKKVKMRNTMKLKKGRHETENMKIRINY